MLTMHMLVMVSTIYKLCILCMNFFKSATNTGKFILILILPVIHTSIMIITSNTSIRIPYIVVTKFAFLLSELLLGRLAFHRKEPIFV